MFKMYVFEAKWLSLFQSIAWRKKGELKNEGGTHDVIENKGKKK